MALRVISRFQLRLAHTTTLKGCHGLDYPGLLAWGFPTPPSWPALVSVSSPSRQSRGGAVMLLDTWMKNRHSTHVPAIEKLYSARNASCQF
ncbi:hypothetical protein PISMIDRAFT_402444 [Pisolithus microcarpus 441]|uniref:Uncharacterized protein n=1 Tax=Pisolithus microcarpus 441 TaxID=765257 RepID=A0A0C9ZF46_9AGAM|nr:hypothetical protein PISMIDRAFT_402444 [Pisolithus microcarpus 441]